MGNHSWPLKCNPMHAPLWPSLGPKLFHPLLKWDPHVCYPFFFSLESGLPPLQTRLEFSFPCLTIKLFLLCTEAFRSTIQIENPSMICPLLHRNEITEEDEKVIHVNRNAPNSITHGVMAMAITFSFFTVVFII